MSIATTRLQLNFSSTKTRGYLLETCHHRLRLKTNTSVKDVELLRDCKKNSCNTSVIFLYNKGGPDKTIIRPVGYRSQT